MVPKLEYIVWTEKSIYIIIYNLIAFKVFRKKYSPLFLTFMEKSFHFIMISSKNISILIKGSRPHVLIGMPLFSWSVDFRYFTFAVCTRIISLFLYPELCSFRLSTHQWSNVALECSNIHSSWIYNINVSIHLNLILFYNI